MRQLRSWAYVFGVPTKYLGTFTTGFGTTSRGVDVGDTGTATGIGLGNTTGVGTTAGVGAGITIGVGVGAGADFVRVATGL